jgi:hypothetical protein
VLTFFFVVVVSAVVLEDSLPSVGMVEDTLAGLSAVFTMLEEAGLRELVPVVLNVEGEAVDVDLTSVVAENVTPV